MLRTHLIRFAVTVSLVVLATQAALANIYMDVQYLSGGDAGSTAYAVNVSSPSKTVTLDVYALVTDTSPSTTSDMWKSLAANFFVAGNADLGDVAWGSFSANTGTSTKGTQFTSTYGGLGLGGSATTQTLSTAWYAPTTAQFPSYSNANGVLYTPPSAGSPVGVEYLLGTITVSFSRNASITNAVEPLASLSATKIGSAKSFNFADSGGTYAGIYGTASNVGDGASNLLYTLSGAGLKFNLSGGTLPTTNPAVLSATLAINGPTTGLGGGNLPLVGQVSNTGTAPANLLDWASSNTGGVPSFTTPASGNGVAVGAPTTLSGSMSLPPNLFGPITSQYTFTGMDASTSAALTPVPVNLTANEIGKGTWQPSGSDGNGTQGGPYGNLMATQTTLTNWAGLTSTLGNSATSYGIGSSTATILAGSGALSTVTEAWRSRAPQEVPGGVGQGGANLPVYSDVVSLNGITGGSNSVYAMQVTYDPATLGGTASANKAASGGFLFLGYRTGGNWQNATAGNSAVGTDAYAGGASPYIGSWQDFTSVGGPGHGFTLSDLLGSYGVDTANNSVWAVVDHSGAEFAAVPEPGTIGLLVAGVAALGYAYRRRKVAKA